MVAYIKYMSFNFAKLSKSTPNIYIDKKAPAANATCSLMLRSL